MISIFRGKISCASTAIRQFRHPAPCIEAFGRTLRQSVLALSATSSGISGPRALRAATAGNNMLHDRKLACCSLESEPEDTPCDSRVPEGLPCTRVGQKRPCAAVKTERVPGSDGAGMMALPLFSQASHQASLHSSSPLDHSAAQERPAQRLRSIEASDAPQHGPLPSSPPASASRASDASRPDSTLTDIKVSLHACP